MHYNATWLDYCTGPFQAVSPLRYVCAASIAYIELWNIYFKINILFVRHQEMCIMCWDACDSSRHKEPLVYIMKTNVNDII